jgi:hypothetical protein
VWTSVAVSFLAASVSMVIACPSHGCRALFYSIFALLYSLATSAMVQSGLPADVGESEEEENGKLLPQDDGNLISDGPSVTIQHVSSLIFLSSGLLWTAECIGGVLQEHFLVTRS